MQLIIFCVALFALSGLTHYFFRDENSCYKSLRGCVWQVIWTAAVGAVVGTFTAAVVVPPIHPDDERDERPRHPGRDARRSKRHRHFRARFRHL